ncbi:hypothetical protein B0H11DRAFT_1913324 [Mycena galericulata]|nr:hypothetical protein B0H11DRAFT_1913324 [Mycena galericulata]
MGKSPKKSRTRTAPANGNAGKRKKRHATHDTDDSDRDLSPAKPRDPSKRKVKAPKKADEDSGKADKGDSGAARVFWEKDATRTERLLDWLTTHVDERIKLFSDSTQDANEAGRRKKTGKTTKMTYYSMMADAVFSVDADLKKPVRYARSVENYVGRLRKRYRDVNQELGQTGAHWGHAVYYGARKSLGNNPDIRNVPNIPGVISEHRK